MPQISFEMASRPAFLRRIGRSFRVRYSVAPTACIDSIGRVELFTPAALSSGQKPNHLDSQGNCRLSNKMNSTNCDFSNCDVARDAGSIGIQAPRIWASTMLPEQSPGNPGHLTRLIADLEAAGIRPTPLNVIAHATDTGLSDAEVTILVDEMAASRGLDEVAA